MPLSNRSGSLQVDDESRTAAQLTLHRYIAAHSLHHLFHNGKAQSRSAGGPGARLVHAVKAFENALEVFAGNADAGIADCNAHTPVLSVAALDGDFPIGPVKLHGIVEQIY